MADTAPREFPEYLGLTDVQLIAARYALLARGIDKVPDADERLNFITARLAQTPVSPAMAIGARRR